MDLEKKLKFLLEIRSICKEYKPYSNEGVTLNRISDDTPIINECDKQILEIIKSW